MKRTLFTSANLDILEKISLLVVFLFFMLRVLTDLINNGSLINLIYFFDQTLIVIFLILRRRAIMITQNFSDWFLGMAGTFLPLLIIPVEKTNIISTTAVAMIMLAGMAIHLSAKLVLRRSFGVVAANRGVKVKGPYRVVRHPMYAGYMILQLGFLLGGWSLQNFVIIVTCWILFFWRITAEERILCQDPNYRALLLRVRFRLIPGIY